MEILEWNTVLQPFISLFILIILMIIMIILYMKVRIWLAILIVFLFSIILGITSISVENIPLNPYFSIFFILFQSVFFLMFSLEVFKR